MITGYGATIVDGAWLTLQLALLSMLLAIVLGLLGAAFRLSPVRWLAWCGDLYATVVRGIVAQGTPTEVLDADLLWRVFGVRALVDRHPLADHPRLTWITQA